MFINLNKCYQEKIFISLAAHCPQKLLSFIVGSHRIVEQNPRLLHRSWWCLVSTAGPSLKTLAAVWVEVWRLDDDW